METGEAGESGVTAHYLTGKGSKHDLGIVIALHLLKVENIVAVNQWNPEIVCANLSI